MYQEYTVSRIRIVNNNATAIGLPDDFYRYNISSGFLNMRIRFLI